LITQIIKSLSFTLKGIMVSSEDMDLVTILDDPDEVVEAVRRVVTV